MRWMAPGLVLLMAGGTFISSGAGDDVSARAKTLHFKSIVVDTHDDTTQRLIWEKGFDLAARHADGNIDIPRMKEGGLGAIFFSIWLPGSVTGPETVKRPLDQIDAVREQVRRHPKELALCTTAEEVRRAHAQGKIAALMGVEGGHMIASDLGVLRMYAALGVRYMTLTHSVNDEWADSSTDKPVHNGLTEFGKDVVREMNRLGMIVDISHVSDKTFYDALAVTTKPVIASHSSCRALSDVPRNMTDDMIRALAKNGGVIAINFGEGFLNPKDAELLKKAINSVYTEPTLTGKALDDYSTKQFHEEMVHPAVAYAAIDDAVAHIDHAVKIAGIDHVGIGSDFDGISAPPKGLEDISRMASLKAALRKKGYSEPDIRKIFGGNTLRVLREVAGK